MMEEKIHSPGWFLFGGVVRRLGELLEAGGFFDVSLFLNGVFIRCGGFAISC
jgi:hypothetical protein